MAEAQPPGGEESPEVAPDHGAADEGRTPSTLPLRLTERPLTLPRGKVVITSGVGVDHDRVEPIGDDCVMTDSGVICLGGDAHHHRTHLRTSSGVAVGAIDALEVGLVPLRLRTGTDSAGGREHPVRDPLFYLQAAALRLERFQLGFGYQILLPFRSDTGWLTQSVSLDLLAPSRFVRAEASVFVRFDSPIRRDSLFTTGDRVITPGVAARLTGQIADPFAVFFGFQSSFFDSSIEGHQTDVRTGFVGTIRRSADQPLADIRFTFGVLDLRRHEEAGVPERCVPGDLDCPSPGLAPGPSTPVRHYTFELNATFFFHDAW